MKVHLNPLSNSNTNNSVEILSIGTEILLGNIVNTNSQWIAQELSFLGINHFRQTTIGDNLDRVSNLVLEISQRCNLLITTGGLGPTPDDLTTEAIAKAFNHSLFERANIWTGIKQKINRDLTNIETSYLKKQCLFPKNASIINNPRGIAPGMIWQPLKNFTIMTFPGVPEELKDMWRETGKDYINKYFSEDKIFFSNTLKFAGIGESSVTEKITELLELKNPTVAPYANIGEVKIRITAKATNISEATSLIKPVKEKIVKQFPTNIIGENEDTLASVLVSELSHRKESLAFAESCTGGLLSSFITSIPGSSKVFKGSIIAYKNEIKQSILNVPNDLIEKYAAFRKLMHAEDCKVIAQIKHGGSKAAYAASIGVPFLVPTLKDISPEDMEHGKNMVNKLTPNEMAEFVSNLKGAGNFKVMEKNDIELVIEQFKQAAVRAFKAKLDGIEIHAGHGYVISSFLSAATNQRKDEYGGSLKNRMRLLTEIIDAIRSELPRSFPIIIRLDGEEINIKNGLTSSESIEIAKNLESKVDAIHVSSYANPASGADFTKAPLNHKKEGFVKVASLIKEALKIPVIAVGRIEPDKAEEHITNGKFNFLAMGRKLLADPNLPNKLMNNESRKIKPCHYSYECVSRIFLNGQMVCAADVGLGKKDKEYSIKNLAIIGAGPAGLELALQAAN